MQVVENVDSDPVERIDEVAAGSRMFVVLVYDPSVQRDVAGATIVETEKFDDIDGHCASIDMPFRLGILHAAAEQVVSRMFDGAVPTGTIVKNVVEVSKRELKEMLAQNEQTRAEAFSPGNAS